MKSSISRMLDMVARYILFDPLYDAAYLPEQVLHRFWNSFMEMDRWAFSRSKYFEDGDFQLFQRERLKCVLDFARDQTLHWSRLIPRDIGSDPFNALKELPFLTRNALIDSEPDLFIAQKTPEWRREKILTSGTTTVPLEFYADRLLFIRMEAAIKAILGFRGNDKLMRANLKFPPFRPCGIQISFSMAGRHTAYRRIASHLKKFRPTHLFGTTSTVLDMAHIFCRYKLHYPFQSATIVGEHLFEKDKIFIESVLGCPVFSLYASRETGGPIAYECEKRAGMHINMASFLVEILDENGRDVGEGEEGDVVITMFENKATMFIRYKIGDRASRTNAPCACGRKSSRIFLKGRTMQLVALKNGDTVSLLSVAGLIRDLIPAVRQFQFIQSEAGKIVARLAVAGAIPANLKQRFFIEAGKRFGNQLSIELDTVNRIEGKNILFIKKLGEKSVS